MELEYTRTGRPFTCNDTVAKILLKRGLARHPGVIESRQLVAETTDAAPRAKRAYKRRDLKAEE